MRKAMVDFKRAVAAASPETLEDVIASVSETAHRSGADKKRWLDIARLLRRELRRRK